MALKNLQLSWQAHRLPSLQQTQKENKQGTCMLHQAGQWEECPSTGWGMVGAGRTKHSRGSYSFLSLHSLTQYSVRQEPLTTATRAPTGLSPKTW